MVKLDICGSIPAYTKNLLVSWSDYKDLSLEVDSINWNSLKKKYSVWNCYTSSPSIVKVYSYQIRDLRFYSCLYKKLIDILVLW